MLHHCDRFGDNDVEVAAAARWDEQQGASYLPMRPTISFFRPAAGASAM